MNATRLWVGIAFLATAIWLVSGDASAQRQKEYRAKQLTNLKVDGDLGEWNRAEFVAFDELKDVGVGSPNANDFTGRGAVAWSEDDPTRIYFAVEITDDELQDIHPFNNTWWEDDSVEFMFDFDNEQVQGSLVQFTLGANGEDLSAAASEQNTEWVVINEGDTYIYEVAIDPTAFPRGPNPGNATKGDDFEAEADLLIGLSFHANDCENGTREHQIGWIPGGAWDALSYGDLIFDSEILAVEASGKLPIAWGYLKSR